jgi:pSer/pThr/pTyr-binding forkhead associated (FHA) protein
MNDPPPADPIRQTLAEDDLPEHELSGFSFRPIPLLEPASQRPARPQPRDDGTQTFRPSLRPPTPLLHVLDDNQQSAEVVRLRTASFVIGRTEGDLRLPHDRLISSRHAQILREQTQDGFTWRLRDLQSANGSFVRVRRARLAPGSVVLLGRTRLRFELPRGAPPAPGAARQTLDLSDPQSNPLAVLVELLPGGDGRRFPLVNITHRLGRDPQHATLVLDDPALSPSHALLTMQPGGTWVIEDLDSLNGLWLCAGTVRLVHGASFLLGEQVLVFALP